jgi:plastocyanin
MPNKSLIVATAVLTSLIIVSTGFIPSTTTNIKAQIGSMAMLQNVDASYAISIVPGAAQRDSPYHYFPPAVAVPTGTTVAWFNNDQGQPHTVTSGNIDSPDSGSLFNSGIMPATANSFFQYTFNDAGNFVYHCEIHPWRVAVVSASNALDRQQNFELLSGVGPTWNFSKDFRTLLNINPLTVPLDGTTPITYNITILEDGANQVFSELFTTSGEALPIELIRGTSNETRSFGPDFSSTGAYHIEGAFLKPDTDYAIVAEIAAINSVPPENSIANEFALRTVQ